MRVLICGKAAAFQGPLIDSPLFPCPKWGSFFMGCNLKWSQILTSFHQIQEFSALLCFNIIHECLKYWKKGIKGLNLNPEIAVFFSVRLFQG